MSSFDEREKSFEKKFAHDQELQFKVSARRNKYIGQWASKILGYNEEKEKEYIQSIIKADFAEAGDEDVFRKVKEDLKNHNIPDEDIRKIKYTADSWRIGKTYKDEDGFCRSVDLEEISKNKYNLSPSRYIKNIVSKNDDTNLEDEIKVFTSELNELSQKSLKLDNEIISNLKKLNLRDNQK